MPTAQDLPTTSSIGRRTPRVDGPLKVSGKAQYASDFHFPGMLYAVPVEATIANGRVVKLDTAVAQNMPGVRAIFHRENIGKIYRSVLGPGFEGIMDERRPPLLAGGTRSIRMPNLDIALDVRFCQSTKSACMTRRSQPRCGERSAHPETP